MRRKENDVLKTIVYYAKLLAQTNKGFYLAYCLTILLDGLLPVGNVVIGKILVQSLLKKSFSLFLLFSGIIVTINLVAAFLKNRCAAFMNTVYDILQTKLEIGIADKMTQLKFETIESEEYQNQLEKAKVGISWYSGGIAGVSNNMSAFISGLLTICGTLTIIAQFSIWVVVIILLISILNILATALAQRRDVAFRKRLVTVNRKLGYFLNIFKKQSISKEVRLYEADDLIETRVNHFLNTEWKEERKRTKFGNKIRVWIDVINYADQTFLYLYFAWQMIQKVIDISSFTLYLNTGIIFYNGIVSVTAHYIEIKKNASFLKEYRIFMELPERSAGSAAPNLSPKKLDSIVFQNVSFRYPQSDKFVLQNVSVTIHRGEKISLIGLNGAGKTTFIKLLCRLYEPTFGEILLNGRPLRYYNEDEYLKTLSVVFQDFNSFAFSISENIAGKDPDRKRLYHTLKSVGLDAKVASLPQKENTSLTKEFDETGVEFSGGEKQQLAIARAFYKNTDLIILDEPTASLDPVAEYQIFKLFKRMIENRTAIFISHRLSSCLLCDRIILFHNGKVKASGSHNHMLQDDLYREMWEAQSKYYV